jgi:hypothetical protein
VIRVRFACGHTVQGDERMTQAECRQCGETRVSHVTAPPPRFSGVVLGPCAQFENLPAVPVRLTKET